MPHRASFARTPARLIPVLSGFLLMPAAPGQGRDGEAKAVATPAPKWRSLFNGKDLTGWKPKIVGHALGVNFASTFRVEDGVLKVCYDGYERFDGRFGHLFYDTPFADYRLRVEYRFVGEQVAGGPGWAFRNSGLMLHGQSPESMALDQDFPASIEVQLLGGPAKGTRTTANLCTPGTHVVMDGKLVKRHCTNSKSETYRGDRWVTVEVEIRGNSVKHIVEGKTVLEYTDPQLDDGRDAKRAMAAGQARMLRRGSISLQSESHPVEFRKVEIMEFPAAVNAAGQAPGAAWTDLLAGGDVKQRWRTEGNWQLQADGVVALTPRKGEQGWRRFASYLWLDGSYGEFEIEFDYRLESRGNSGFYFHVGDLDQPVQTGIEVQLYESHSRRGERLTDHDAGGIIPGVPPRENAARPAGEWNRMRVLCRGDDLTVELNGLVVNQLKLTHPKIAGRPRTGSIGFQDHGLPLALRRVRIRRL